MDQPLCSRKQTPDKKKFRTQPLAGKVMLTLFLDAQGLILEHYQESGTRVNSVHFSEMLWDQLKPAF
jgi:hypothetical protein